MAKSGDESSDKIVNQELVPNGPEIDGLRWEKMAEIQVLDGSLEVRFDSILGQESMIADAVRVEQLSRYVSTSTRRTDPSKPDTDGDGLDDGASFVGPLP